MDQNNATDFTMKLKKQEKQPGSVWTHPYILYVLLTIVLFSFILLMGWLALSNDWLSVR